MLLLWRAVWWKVHSWSPFLLLGHWCPRAQSIKLPFTLWLNPEAFISWWRPQPPKTEVTDTRSSNQSHHTHLSAALSHFTSLHTCSPGFVSSPLLSISRPRVHASRPRIPSFPHCSPRSSFLQHPGKSSTQCSPNSTALLPHDQDVPTGLLYWTCLQTPWASVCMTAFVHCFLSEEYSPQELWDESELLKSLAALAHCTPFPLTSLVFTVSTLLPVDVYSENLSPLGSSPAHDHFVCYTFSNFRNNPGTQQG